MKKGGVKKPVYDADEYNKMRQKIRQMSLNPPTEYLEEEKEEHKSPLDKNRKRTQLDQFFYEMSETEADFKEMIQTAGIKAKIETDILDLYKNLSTKYHRVINQQNIFIESLSKQIENLRDANRELKEEMKSEIDNKTKDYKNKYENMCEMIKIEKRQEIDRLEEDYKMKLSSMTSKYKESLEQQTQRFNSKLAEQNEKNRLEYMKILEKTTREKQELMDKSLNRIKNEYQEQFDLYLQKEKDAKKRIAQLELVIQNNRSNQQNIMEDKQSVESKLQKVVDENMQLKNIIRSRENDIQELQMNSQNLQNNIQYLKANIDQIHRDYDNQLDQLQAKSKDTIITLRNQIQTLQNALLQEQQRSRTAEEMLRNLDQNLRPR